VDAESDVPTIERDQVSWKPANQPAFELPLAELFEGL